MAPSLAVLPSTPGRERHSSPPLSDGKLGLGGQGGHTSLSCAPGSLREVAPTGDGSCNLGMCPDREVNWRPFTLQDHNQPAELHWPGLMMCVFERKTTEAECHSPHIIIKSACCHHALSLFMLTLVTWPRGLWLLHLPQSGLSTLSYPLPPTPILYYLEGSYSVQPTLGEWGGDAPLP